MFSDHSVGGFCAQAVTSETIAPYGKKAFVAIGLGDSHLGMGREAKSLPENTQGLAEVRLGVKCTRGEKPFWKYAKVCKSALQHELYAKQKAF